MNIKDVINKKNTGKAKRMAIGGAVLSPIAIPVLKAVEGQILLHSASTIAFGGMVKTGTGMSLTGVLAPVGIGLIALGGVGLVATALIRSAEKEEMQQC